MFLVQGIQVPSLVRELDPPSVRTKTLHAATKDPAGCS